MRVLFMGTPDFAVPSLEALLNAGHEVCGVLTQPDRPVGRGMKLAQSPVKVCALSHGLTVYQPETLRRYAIRPLLEELQPDVICVVAYGQLLPPYVLEYPRYGCINVHASLLPKYRGAGPIQAAIINGETETGVTTMFMGRKLDNGDMLLMARTPIGPDETADMLHDRLKIMGADLLVQTLTGLEQGSIRRIPQDDTQMTYAPMLTKDDGRMDWSLPARTLYNRARGVNPWPGAFTYVDGQPMKLGAIEMGEPSEGAPGTVRMDGNTLTVVCGDGMTLRVGMLQPAGKRMMPAGDYARGHKLPERFEGIL
ncbi:MAG: methionyl-tRNA formyltransferase [Clostridiales bacterium]|nr:methionyl-tRNA formyltransferase [Clostridiales bacterium]